MQDCIFFFLLWIQEQRFKSYMNHLELCLKEFQDICFQIREPVQALFQTHTHAVMVALQPGLTSLAWNSMNIDAFLHQVHAGKSGPRTPECYTGWSIKNAMILIINFEDIINKAELLFISFCGKFIFQQNDTMIINFGWGVWILAVF